MTLRMRNIIYYIMFGSIFEDSYLLMNLKDVLRDKIWEIILANQV